jgi:Immunity protein 50
MDTSSNIADKIEHSKLLTDVFGRWPSFHDAEVVSLELSRESKGISQPNLKARIHVFEATPEVDSQGFYILKNHVLVSFLFSGIDESTVTGFNQQNVLWDLAIIDISSKQLEYLKFEVHFSSSFGVEAEFKCRSVEVESVKPIGPQ